MSNTLNTTTLENPYCFLQVWKLRALKKSPSLLRNLFSTILKLASLQIKLALRARMVNLLPTTLREELAEKKSQFAFRGLFQFFGDIELETLVR